MNLNQFFTEDNIRKIRKDAPAAERQGFLTEEMMKVIYEKQWLKIMVPKSCYGLEWSLPQIVRFLEAAAYVDGNFGWTLNLCAGANLFAGYMNPEVAKALYRDPKASIAGSGAITGKAIKHGDGYLISGFWKYATGSTHASYFSANCYLIDENGNDILNENGEQEFSSFIIPRDQVTILKTWDGVGMKATSSHDFSVDNTFVPQNYSFLLTESSPYETGVLYEFPFILLAIFNITVMTTGLALRFTELFKELAKGKTFKGSERKLIDVPEIKEAIARHESQLEQQRQEFYGFLNESWHAYEKGKPVDEAKIKFIRNTAAALGTTCRTMVNELYALCGMSVLPQSTDINRVWRDFTVASQHNVVSPVSQYV